MIYFVQAGDTGPIKIGSARNLRERISSLRTASPLPLRLLAVIEGDRREEHLLHKRFAAERLRGEWFDPSGKLVAFLTLCRRMQKKDEKPGIWLLMQLWDPLGPSEEDQRWLDDLERRRVCEQAASNVRATEKQRS